jgi:voltage-gated potassium channel
VIIGSGAQARSVAQTVLDNGAAESVVTIVASNAEDLAAALAHNLPVVIGPAACSTVPGRADAAHATAIVVALEGDDLAALATMTARTLAPRARIIASVHEPSNAHLLRWCGADCVLVAPAAVGRLLGQAARTSGRRVRPLTGIGQFRRAPR